MVLISHSKEHTSKNESKDEAGVFSFHLFRLVEWFHSGFHCLHRPRQVFQTSQVSFSPAGISFLDVIEGSVLPPVSLADWVKVFINPQMCI